MMRGTCKRQGTCVESPPWAARLMVLALLAGGAAHAGGLAEALVEKGGVQRGICSLPRCGDGTLAVAVAKASGLLVHAQDSRPEAVAAAR